MSWQATAWAVKQKTGKPGRKATLLALANYADPTGLAWPSQETLSKNTEQSIDTVQRQLKQLQAGGLVYPACWWPRRKAGWPSVIYYLPLPPDDREPQNAAHGHKPQNAAHGRNHKPQNAAQYAAPLCGSVCRTAMRHEPSLKQTNENAAAGGDARAREDQARELSERDVERQEEWLAIWRELHRLIGPTLTASWFDTCRLGDFNSGTLVIHVSGTFKRTRIERDYMDPLHAACRREYPSLQRVRLVDATASAAE